jgi:hypothetical protein
MPLLVDRLVDTAYKIRFYFKGIFVAQPDDHWYSPVVLQSCQLGHRV